MLIVPSLSLRYNQVARRIERHNSRGNSSNDAGVIDKPVNEFAAVDADASKTAKSTGCSVEENGGYSTRSLQIQHANHRICLIDTLRPSVVINRWTLGQKHL